jgi:hypothetical protein
MSAARRLAFAAVSIALLTCARAQAGGRVGFEAWSGWNRHSMTAVNATLRSFDDDFGTALAPIQNGDSWGFGIRFWPRQDLLVRVGIERLSVQAQDSGIELDLGADAITLGATGFFPSWRRIRCGAGLGLGPVLAHGRFVGRGASLGLTGSGLGVHTTGEAVVALVGGVSLDAAAGYRWASINGLKVGESTSGLSPEYSGFFARVGLALDIPLDN